MTQHQKQDKQRLASFKKQQHNKQFMGKSGNVVS